MEVTGFLGLLLNLGWLVVPLRDWALGPDEFEFEFQPCFLIGTILGKLFSQNECQGWSEDENNSCPTTAKWKRLKSRCKKLLYTQKTIVAITIQLYLQNCWEYWKRKKDVSKKLEFPRWAMTINTPQADYFQILFLTLNLQLVKEEESFPLAIKSNFRLKIYWNIEFTFIKFIMQPTSLK